MLDVCIRIIHTQRNVHEIFNNYQLQTPRGLIRKKLLDVCPISRIRFFVRTRQLHNSH